MVPKKILAVDDATIVHRMYDLVFLKQKNIGTTILHAYNGKEGFILLHRNPEIDLILLDINMPVISGLEFLRIIRKSPAFEKIVVIIVSAKGREADLKKGLELGAQAYLTKPFTTGDLIALVDKLPAWSGKAFCGNSENFYSGPKEID